jgi:hypothetical protein
MTPEQEKINRWFKKYPWTNQTYFNRPHWTRRHFFELVGAGVTGSFLAQRYAKAADVSAAGVTTKGTAKNVVFILLAGAPSHTDTFDLKDTSISAAPAGLHKPSNMNGMYFPTGLMPKLANLTADFAVVRSARAHAVVHTLCQTWVQIGRNPVAALGNIAPNIGSIVAIEKEKERKPSQIFPTFLALNSDNAVGPGYLPAAYAPFKVNANSGGIAATASPATGGQTRFNNRFKLLHALDDANRVTSPYGAAMQDYDTFYTDANALMYNPVVSSAFSFSASESARYGSSTFGNACLVAKQILAANQGTRFIQISYGSWDMHSCLERVMKDHLLPGLQQAAPRRLRRDRGRHGFCDVCALESNSGPECRRLRRAGDNLCHESDAGGGIGRHALAGDGAVGLWREGPSRRPHDEPRMIVANQPRRSKTGHVDGRSQIEIGKPHDVDEPVVPVEQLRIEAGESRRAGGERRNTPRSLRPARAGLEWPTRAAD